MKNHNKQNNEVLTEKGSANRLHEVLKELMNECRIDGVNLSKHTGIPVTTINRLRKDDPSNNPTISTLIPIAKFFSISVSQLIGAEPLSQTRIKGSYNINSETLIQVPLLTWNEAIEWPLTSHLSHPTLTTEHIYSENTYALLVEEDDLENLTKGTALLIDPSLKPEHRDFVIVYKESLQPPTLKQILFDEEQMYLKPLVQGYNISVLTPEHKILGVVVEYKKNLKRNIIHTP